jgi:acetyl esterase
MTPDTSNDRFLPLASPTSANPVLDATVQRFLDAVAASGWPPLHELGYAETRLVLATLQRRRGEPRAAEIEDLTWPIGPFGSVGIRIVRPAETAGTLPAILYFHGGGWVAGDRHTHDRLIREIALGVKAAVVFVDYTRAPEARYPVQNEEAFAATKYVFEQAKALRLDGGRVAVAGDGVGGTIAAAVTLLAKRRGLPNIAFQLLLCPLAARGNGTGSSKIFENGPWITARSWAYFYRAAFAGETLPTEPTAFPLNALISELEGLPAALVITAENDMVRDGGEAYARKLMQAEIEVVSTRYNGTIHNFVLLDALAASPTARAALAQAIDALKAALHA